MGLKAGRNRSNRSGDMARKGDQGLRHWLEIFVAYISPEPLHRKQDAKRKISNQGHFL